MNPIWSLLLMHTWMTNTLALYHEHSMIEFRPVASLHKDALFGYSVSYVPSDKTLIVGAPKAKDVGEVYTCDIRRRNYCTIVHNNLRTDNVTHNYLLGATVKGGSNFFVTCAPRYPGAITSKRKYGTYSLCFYSQDGTLKTLQSLTGDEKEHNEILERYMDSFGWTIDINNENHIAIGSPAAAKGRAIQYKGHSPDVAPEFISAVNKNVKYNFGYSVAYYKFSYYQDIAIGSPYGRIGYGAVYLSSRDIPVIDNDDKDLPVGSLFAATLCSADMEDRKTPSLLVGAPTYARGNAYNRGAVFIYSASARSAFGPIKMTLRAKVCGVKDGGYFGTAIAKLGDLNGDKRDDIAISAPYEDDGRGAVYIYSGAELIKRKAEGQIPYLQRIQRENYRSFGLSLSALTDYDQNGCNELAIGVPGNNSAVVFRCMASITVTVADLVEQKDTGDDVPGAFGFISCLDIKYPRLPTNIEADINVEIVLMHIHAVFRKKDKTSSNSYQFQIKPGKKNTKFCHNLIILTPSDVSYDPTLPYHITAKLIKDPIQQNDFDPSRVLLSNASVLWKAGKVWIGDCKNKQNCTPKLDLKVETSLQSQYIVGSTSLETLNITVHNTGDTAYSTAAKINITGVLASKWPKFCTRESDEEFTCKYSALLRKDTSWETGYIELETNNLVSNAINPKSEINMTVNVYDEFSKAKVEQWNHVVKLISDSENITVRSMAKHANIVNITVDEARITGAHIDHVYSIINNGITTWGNVNATITLRKEVFLSDVVNLNHGDNYVCSESITTDQRNEAYCTIKRIGKGNMLIIVSIDVLPGDLENILRKGNTTVVSTLQFELNGDIKMHSITSTLILYEVLVPTWIIIAAALVGLLLLIILAFAMHECGFLRRKNKEKLKALKRDVKRQSIRRSVMIQHGSKGSNREDLQQLIDKPENIESVSKPNTVKQESRGGNQDDLKQLIDKSENVDNTNKPHSITTEAEIAPPKTTRKKPDILPKPQLKTVHENGCDDIENDTKTETQANKGGPKKDPRMELIIGGLQKNVRDRQPEGTSNSR